MVAPAPPVLEVEHGVGGRRSQTVPAGLSQLGETTPPPRNFPATTAFNDGVDADMQRMCRFKTRRRATRVSPLRRHQLSTYLDPSSHPVGAKNLPRLRAF